MTTPAARRARIALGGAVKALKKTIQVADLTVAATTQSFAMGSLPAGAIVVGYDVNVTVAFVGLTAPTVDLGDSGGNSNEYADNVSIASVARISDKIAKIATIATADADATYGQPEADLINEMKNAINALAALISDGNGAAVVVKVDDTVTNLDQASAGEVQVQVLYLEAAKAETAQ